LHKLFPHLSGVRSPLRVLLEKETAWTWDKEQKDTFEELNELVYNTLVFALYGKIQI